MIFLIFQPKDVIPKILLDYGPYGKNTIYNEALKCTAAGGHLDIVELMIINLFKFNLHPDFYGPLRLASKYGKVNVIK